MDTSTPFVALSNPWVWTVLGYLLGSIPFGMVLASIMGLGNLRDIGSGNIGATNVLRTGSKSAAALTLILDGGKGAVAVLLARYFAGELAAYIAALAAMIGHCYPIWLKFAGGKGVATVLGVYLALSLPLGALACATWLITALILRISSLSALVAAASAMIWVVVLGLSHMLWLAAALSALIFWRHRSNISRLLQGTEPRIGKKS